MIRATTGGVLKSYRRNLMNSFISQSNALNTVLTKRNFNSYAEDPAAAAKAFQLRKARMTTDSQWSICSDVYKKYQTGWSSLDTVSKLIDTENGGTSMTTLKETTLRLLNDPNGSTRQQLNTVLSELSDTIIQNMNQKYGENFIFAGADGHNVPFEIKNDKLYYRGVPVDAAVPNVAMDGSSPLEVDPATGLAAAGSGTYLKVDPSALISRQDFDDIVTNDPTAVQPQIFKQADAATPLRFNEKGELDPAGDYYMKVDSAETMAKADYDAAAEDAAKLEYLVNEKYFVDIGLGFQENENGQLIESSGFNAALNGLTFLGYGLDEDGDPKNIYSLVQRMTEIASRVTDDRDWTTDEYEEFYGLVQKLETAASEYKTEYTRMSAATTKLKNNQALLEDNYYNLVEQYADIEDVDMAEAINSFLWAQYSYNAALKVGNSVLSQSLMDYLN